MLKHLIAYFTDLNLKTDSGDAPLILAARHGHSQIIELLLQQDGITTAVTDRHKMTAIHHSAKNGHNRSLSLLLKHALKDGNVINAQDALQRTALMLAAEHGHIESVEALIKAGADVNVLDSNSRSALYRAVGI